jgi:acyl carrier protein
MSIQTSIRDRVIQVISSVMNVPASQLTESSSPESVSQWESMKHINLVLAIEEEFDVRFDDQQISELQSVQSIISVVESSS